MALQNLKTFIKTHRLLRAAALPVVGVTRRICQSRQSQLLAACSELFQAVEGGSLHVTVPSFGGCFEIGCRSHLLHRLLAGRDYEPGLAQLVKQRIDPAKDAIDIGANIGLYTVLMARLIGSSSRVLAIEPTAGALKYLRKNIESNGQNSKVTVFDGVVAETRSQYELSVIEGMEEFSSLGTLVHPLVSGKNHGQIAVRGETIDNLVDQLELRPGFIKMDIEGAEYRVLTGSVRTLRRHRPIVLSECSNVMLRAAGSSSQAITAFFTSNGYIVEHIEENEILATPQELHVQ